jgi:hypothetical protein
LDEGVEGMLVVDTDDESVDEVSDYIEEDVVPAHSVFLIHDVGVIFALPSEEYAVLLGLVEMGFDKQLDQQKGASEQMASLVRLALHQIVVSPEFPVHSEGESVLLPYQKRSGQALSVRSHQFDEIEGSDYARSAHLERLEDVSSALPLAAPALHLSKQDMFDCSAL